MTLVLFEISSSQQLVKEGTYPNGRLEIGITGLGTKYFGEFTDDNLGYGLAFNTRYALTNLPELAFGARYTHSRLFYDRRYRNKFGSDFFRQFPRYYYPDADKLSLERNTIVNTFDLLMYINLFPRAKINYYVMIGASALAFSAQDIRNSPTNIAGRKEFYPEFKDEDNFDFHLLGGIGADYFVTKDFSVGFQLLYRNLNTDLLDGYALLNADGSATNPDAFAEFGLKLSYYLFYDNDYDGDGIPNDLELEYGTDPYNADTDGDGLSDFDEINNFGTNPLIPDTDGDGLNDGDEIYRYNTNPLMIDTDGDGLTDYEESIIYNTNPRLADSDRDGLTDLEEIKLGSNPLDADSDKDGILDNEDDCPTVPGVPELRGCPDDSDKKLFVRDTVFIEQNPDTIYIVQEIKVKEGEVYKPKGVNFKAASAEILVESELILDDVVDWLKKDKDIHVEIQGHTDQDGSLDFNLILSEKRALTVKQYLIKNGINPKRLSTKGFGKSIPIIENEVDEKAKARNRRIEFKVIKQ